MTARMVLDKPEVKIKMAPGCKDLLPTRATSGSSGFDLKAAEDVTVCGTKIVPTGVFLEIPEGFEAQIRPRSGLSLDGLVAILGTIDSDYRGELKIIVTSTGCHKIKRGNKIAQLVIAPIYTGGLTSVTQLCHTERGDGGFGSSGT